MPRGTVYLVGSPQGPALPAAVKRALAKVEGRQPRIAASYAAMHGEPRGLAFMVSSAAKLFGVEVERLRVPGENGATSDKEARKILDGADLVFLSGGDPVAGAELLTSSGADAWLRAAHERGTSFLGISAGAILLSACWARWPEDEGEWAKAPFDGGTLVPCTRVVDDLVVDCHAEEDDWVELLLVQGMLRAAGRSPRLRGLPHGGGVVVDAEGKLETLGLSPFTPG